MAQLFISHSSRNNAEGVALRDWLAGEGWDDVFLDIDPHRGIVAGERWERALHQAAYRCEAVLFLVSRDWLASGWCLKEFGLAHKLNKRLFGLLIDPIPVEELPVNLTSTWQLVDLASGRDHELFPVTIPVTGDQTDVTFSVQGLARLRNGLRRAGLDPSFFAWPPERDPDRPPYPGLKPLEAEDAGIFYGREAPTIEALDRLRALGTAAPPRWFCILGASGSGKSSFLRAGLWPRLARDDRHFLPLPVLRPERAAISGRSGLAAVLETALAARGIAMARAEIRAAVAAGADAVRPLLAQLVRRIGSTLVDGDDTPPTPPLVVLPIDQAEELFGDEGSQEAAALLALVRDLTSGDEPAVAVLLTIRSDAFERIQLAPELEGVSAQTMTLAPMPRGMYATIIESPAARLRDSNRPLFIDPALTRALLADMEEGGGRDALPLLAFTLERLWLEYGARRRLVLADYEELGRVRGSIEAAVERALSAADRNPRLPGDRQARLALLRRGMIPWLAGIDPETGSPRRRVARRHEIPAEAHPIVDLLVEERLLSTDIDGRTGEATVEPAHEALLRQWGLLQGWLEADFAALATLDGVRRAAGEWEANARDPAWLAHGGERLLEAERLRERPDLAAQLTEGGRDYLAACRVRADQAAANERQRARQRRALQIGSLAAAIVFALFSVAAVFLWRDALAQKAEAERQRGIAEGQTQLAVTREEEARRQQEEAERQRGLAERQTELARQREDEAQAQREQAEAQRRAADEQRERADANAAEARRNAELAEANAERSRRSEAAALVEVRRSQRSESLTLADRAQRELAGGNALAAMRLALSGLPKDLEDPDRPLVAQTMFALSKAHLDNRLRALLRPSRDQVNEAVFGERGATVLTSTRDGLATRWDWTTSTALDTLEGRRLAAFQTVQSPDGRLVATSFQSPPSVLIREVSSGRAVQELRVQAGNLPGSRMAFTPDGRRLILAFQDYGVGLLVWDVASGRLAARLSSDLSLFAIPNALQVSRDGRVLLLSTSDGVRIWDLPAGRMLLADADQLTAPLDARSAFKASLSEGETVRAAALLKGGQRAVLLGSKVVYLVDLAQRRVTKSWPYVAEGHGFAPSLLAIDEGEARVVLSTGPNEVGVFELETGRPVATLRGHATKVTLAAISPNGRLVAAAAEDASVRVWRADGGDLLQVFRGEEERVGGLSFSPDSATLLTYGGDAARVWDLRDEAARSRPSGIGPADRLVRVNGPGTVAVLATKREEDGPEAIGLVDLATGARLRSLQPTEAWEREDDQTAFSPGGRYAAAARSVRSSRDGEAARREIAALAEAHPGTLSGPLPPSLDEVAVVEVVDLKEDRLVAALVLPGWRQLRLGLSDDGAHACIMSRWGKTSRGEIWDVAARERLVAFEQAGEDGVCRFGNGRALVETRESFRAGLVLSGWDLAGRKKLFETRPGAGPDVRWLLGGAKILVSGTDRAPKILDAATGAEEPRLDIPARGIKSVSVAPGGQSATVERSDGEYWLWDLGAHKPVARISLDKGWGGSVEYSRDGRLAFQRTGSSDGTAVRVFEAATGRVVKTASAGKEAPTEYGVVRSDGRFALRSARDVVEIHDLEGTAPPRRLRNDGDVVASGFVEAGERFVAVSRTGILQLWDARTGQSLLRQTVAASEKPLRIADRGRLVGLLLRDGHASVHDGRSAAPVWQSGRSEVLDIAVAADGRSFAVLGPEGLESYASEGGRRTGAAAFDPRNLTSLEILPDNARAFAFVRGGKSLVFDVRTGAAVAEPEGAVAAHAPSGGRPLLALAFRDRVEILDLDRAAVVASRQVSAQVARIDFAADGHALAILLEDGAVEVLETGTGAVSAVAKLDQASWAGFALSGDEVLIQETGEVLSQRRVRDGAVTDGFEGRWSDRTATAGWRARADTAGAVIAVTTPDNFIRIYRAADGQELSWFSWQGKVFADIALIEGAPEVVAVTEDGQLSTMNYATRRYTRSIRIGGQFSRFQRDVLFARDTRLVATGQDGRTVIASNAVEAITVFASNVAHRGTTAAISEDGALLATLDQDRTLRLWDGAGGGLLLERVLFRSESSISEPEIAFSADGRRLVLSAFLRQPEIVPLPLKGQELLDDARKLVGAPPAAAAPPARGRLGIVMRTLTPDRARARGAPEMRGVVLVEILRDSSAYEAGLRAGDVVLALGETETPDTASLSGAIAASPSGPREIRIVRDGRVLRFRVFL